MGGGNARFPSTIKGDLVHELRIVDLQLAAHLSLGWRADSSVAALVSAGARPEFDGGRDHRPRWRGRLHRSGPMDTLCLVRSYFCVHADELLERAETSPSTIAF